MKLNEIEFLGLKLTEVEPVEFLDDTSLCN